MIRNTNLDLNCVLYIESLEVRTGQRGWTGVVARHSLVSRDVLSLVAVAVSGEAVSGAAVGHQPHMASQ